MTKIELIKTRESDGDWYKVYVDGECKACCGMQYVLEEKALARAEEIFNFLVENKGNNRQIIKTVEI